jgi:hypothetical protein
VNGFIDHLQIVTTSNYSSIANLHSLQLARTHAKSSQSSFASRILVTDLNSVGSSAYVPTMLLSGEYPTSGPIVKVKVTLRLTVSQSVSLGVEPHLELTTRYLLLFDSSGLVFVRRPL